jgi:hypothetical protein
MCNLDRSIRYSIQGTTKVKNAEDVAQIMRSTQNKAVEHALAIHIDQKVVHIKIVDSCVVEVVYSFSRPPAQRKTIAKAGVWLAMMVRVFAFYSLMCIYVCHYYFCECQSIQDSYKLSTYIISNIHTLLPTISTFSHINCPFSLRYK